MLSRVYHVLENAIDVNLEPIKPNARKVSNVLDALQGVANLDDDVLPPAWLDGRAEPPPNEIVPLRNGLLHLPSRVLMEPTPALFTLNGLPFDFDPDAPEPDAWLDFLDSIWPDDPDSVRALQQWFGYLLTADTSQQKILMIVGPTRSGKGTIGRVLRELIGRANVAAPTLQSLGQQFGLANLIGKQAAIVSDARLSGKSDVTTIGERLLSISGEDALSIPRKYRQDFTAQLGTRFVLLTNELPKITDASGALADRFIVLPMKHSFLGHEDRGLAGRLMAELPGILNWAIDGAQDLQRVGYLIQPASAHDHMEELADMASPVRAFIRDECSLGGELEVECETLYQAWCKWCKEKGWEHPGTAQSFGRDLTAAKPHIKSARPRRGGEQRVRVYRGIALLR
jgi:putative DNA primase/helicase